MLVRFLFALLVLLPYEMLSHSHPVWLTFVVALAGFGLGHVMEAQLKRVKSQKSNQAVKVLLSVAVVGVAAVLLIQSSAADTEYYEHVNEVTTHPQKWEGKSLKVHGFVEPGSIDEHIEGDHAVRTFVLEYKGQRLLVKHSGPKPDTFRDLAEVVAEGTLVKKDDGSYILQSTNLMAKCPSKYQQDKRSALPRSAAR